jgi:thioredoxin reductase (NADPH)
MYLSAFARNVYIVIRREGLEATMSQYLIQQIQATPTITLLPYTQVTGADGRDRLECLRLRHTESGEERVVDAGALFIFIGTRPGTDWLQLDLIKNQAGYLVTGRDLVQHPSYPKVWKKNREPFLLETCVPGIFAAGDVRATAMNRVASAVGEGAMAISFVHKYLSEG